MRPQSSAGRSLDPYSSHTLRRFVILLAFMTLWAVLSRAPDPLQVLLPMTSVVAAMDSVIAVLRRDRFNAAVLNHWDSAIAFFGLNCLIRGLA